MTESAGSPAEKPRNPRRELRVFGLVMSAGWGVLGVLAARHGYVTVGAGLTGAGLMFLILTLVAPSALRVPFAMWMGLARMLGWINLHVLLALIFYSLFTVVGMGIRIMRRDVLQRRWDSTRSSYWQRRRSSEDDGTAGHRERFERQF